MTRDVGGHRVDLLRRTINVERQRLQGGQLGPLKSRSSRRVVPVGQVVIEELAAHLAAYPTDGPLSVNEVGENPSPIAAGGPGGTRPPIRWESTSLVTGCRTFAAAQISGGASVKQVQPVLGHASAAIALQTYSHPWPGDEDRTRDVMDAVLSPLRHAPADCLRTEEVADV
jgi:integrase